MLTRLALCSALALVPSSPLDPQGRTTPVLERLALLAGDWALVDTSGQATDLRATYRLSAGGAAVVETLMLGTSEETVTVYHREGERVTATQVSARGGPLRLLPGSSNDPDVLRFMIDEGRQRRGRVSEVRLTLLGDERLRVDWSVSSEDPGERAHTFELQRARTIEELASEVARLRRGLDSLQEELDLRLKTRVKVQRRGEPARSLLETRTLPSGPGWNVSGVPVRVFQHAQTIPFASTYAGQGDGGLTAMHLPFEAGRAGRLRFSVLGGHGYVALVAETRAPPRRISDIPDFSEKLLAGVYGEVVERVVGGHWSDHPRAFEWDFARFEGRAMRLYVIDAETNHYGQVAVSEISILEEQGD